MKFTNKELNEVDARGPEEITELGDHILEFLTNNHSTLEEIYDEFDADNETIKQQVLILFHLKFVVETKDEEFYTAEGGTQYLENENDNPSFF